MLNSWVVSVAYAKKHFKKVVLRSDSAGAKVLTDGVGIEFDEVIPSLDKIVVSEWPWTICKLMSYRDEAKIGPATHVDYDVFLFDPIDKNVSAAPVFFQNYEDNVPSVAYYDDTDMLKMDGVPPWYMEWKTHDRRAVNCGVLGWNDSEFIEWYASESIAFLERNRAGKWGINAILPEQAFLSAAIRERGIKTAEMFRGWDGFFEAERAHRFVHLMATKKQTIGNEMSLSNMAQVVNFDQWKRAQRVGVELSRG